MKSTIIECVNPDKGKSFFVIWDYDTQTVVKDNVGNDLQFLTYQQAETYKKGMIWKEK